MARPELESILRPLKPFQRRTVDHAFDRLFLAPDSTFRFLVADEVGLGKTLVARGVIGRTIQHLWDKVGRIDIVYICSNSSIARSNLPKLQVGAEGHRSVALATRLTMLATDLAPCQGEPGLADSKLNFISFTPSTSINLGHSGGQQKERQVLYHLLHPLVGRTIPLMNMLQGWVSRTDWWRQTLGQGMPIDESIREKFVNAFRKTPGLDSQIHDLMDEWFKRTRQLPREATQARDQLIGRLREILARVCVDALEPNLVILDEFQRFKSMLEASTRDDPASELTRALFDAKTPEGEPVRTLLLSATPYKLYTADAELDSDDHYADFVATTRFLMGEDKVRVAKLQRQLSSFGRALRRATSGNAGQVIHHKHQVEGSLRKVMARTERVSASQEKDAMVDEPKVGVRLEATDIHQYQAYDELFRAVGDRDPMTFWKAAPYLPHFMRDYKFNRCLEQTRTETPQTIKDVLTRHPKGFLNADDIRAWTELDAGNAKLRELVESFLDVGRWQLLWIPPTVPYWPMGGAFEGQEAATKSLLFSAWNVVPDVVSGVLSYEAERRMMGGGLDSYLDPSKQKRPLLKLSETSDETRSRHRLLLLMLPCLTLADRAHPLAAPKGKNRRAWVREQVDTLLADLPDPQEGPIDDRWEWVVPMLLDPGLDGFLEYWQGLPETDFPRPNPEVFPDYVGDLRRLKLKSLGRRPLQLAELLTDLALGSPAILAARALATAGLDEIDRRSNAVILAESFWRLFNRPAVIRLLEQIYKDDGELTRRESAYWRLVLRYCQDGNLQAVLDETWHLNWEQHAWSKDQQNQRVAIETVRAIARVVNPVPSRVHAQFFKTTDSDEVKSEEIRIRGAFALRFGDLRTEDRVINQETIREAFNSPFRPFILASTSVGQEGLDFHPWCHRLIHWNLPGNPVDLEQREGRVHRYKGHAVRRNVAARFAALAFDEWRPGDDLWKVIFDLATQEARANGASDLVPHWIADGGCKVERRVPLLPYTKEVEAFQRLKRQLAAYRIVFGQPRQEELVTLIDQANLENSELDQWVIDLSPRLS